MRLSSAKLGGSNMDNSSKNGTAFQEQSELVTPGQRFGANRNDGVKCYGYVVCINGEEVEAQFTEPESYIQVVQRSKLTFLRRPANLGDLGNDDKSRFVWGSWLTKHINLLSSDPKIGKTFVMVDLARRIYQAECWPDGQEPTFPQGTKTLWICGDRHQDELRDYVEAFGLPLEAVLLNTVPSEPYGGCDLDNPNTLGTLTEFIEGERPGLVIIDTLWRATKKRLYQEEQVNVIAEPLINIAQTYEIPIVASMHLSKDSETLGRRLEGMARSILKLDSARSQSSRPPQAGVQKGTTRNPLPWVSRSVMAVVITMPYLPRSLSDIEGDVPQKRSTRQKNL